MDEARGAEAGAEVVAPRLPWRARWHLFWRRLRFALAGRLIRNLDGATVSRGALQVALDRLAILSEGFTALPRRQEQVASAAVEDVTRALVLALELGGPSLRLEELRDRYVNLRMRAMSKIKRERLQYEAGLKALELRLTRPPDPVPVVGTAAVGAPAPAAP